MAVTLAMGGLATAANLFDPDDVAVDTANNIYIVDNQNNVVRKITAAKQVLSALLPGQEQGGTAAMAFQLPQLFCVPQLAYMWVKIQTYT